MIENSPASSSHLERVPANRRKVLAILLCVAAVLRLASIFILRTYRHPRTWEFGEIAHVIAAGRGYTASFRDGIRIPSAYMPPFYPYLLVTLWKTLGESERTYMLLEGLQALSGVLLVFYIYRLTSILFSTRVALTAAGLIAIWPTFIYVCNEFHSINAYMLIGVAAVYYLVRYIEVSRSWGDAICFGVCMGSLFYCRAETSYLLVMYTFVIVFRCGRRSFSHASAAFLIAALCISPWTVRNYRVFGHVVLVATAAGSNLWIGHNSHARGDANWDPLFASPSQRQTMEPLEVKPDGEVLIDRQATAYALEFARSHPQQEVMLSARKLFYFLCFDPLHKKGGQIAYWGPSVSLFLLALYGAWLHRTRLVTQDLAVTATVSFALFLSVVVFALPRYRIAIDPFLAMYAASAVVTISPNIKKLLAFWPSP